MMAVIVVFHGIVCVLLIILVLIQRGRGGGLVESFSGVESMFGTKTNEFLTKVTTILASVFFVTCLVLAIMSVRQSRSLMSGVRAKPVVVQQETKKEAGAQPEEPQTEPAASQSQEKPKAE
jgi:preprotein translocase subunit SecG